MQVALKKKESSSNKKAKLQEDKRRVQEQLESAQLQLEVTSPATIGILQGCTPIWSACCTAALLCVAHCILWFADTFAAAADCTGA